MIAKNTKVRKAKQSRFHNVVAVAVFLAIFGAGIGFLAYQNFKINSAKSGLEEQANSLQAQLAGLEQQKADLEGQIEDLDSKEYQEQILREQGLFKKEGEEVFTILPEDIEFEVEAVEDEGTSWWLVPLEILKGIF